MHEPKRARRIRDRIRMKARCRRVYPHDPNAKLADHMAVCSCLGCGSRRRYEGAPLQERRALDAFRCDLIDSRQPT